MQKDDNLFWRILAPKVIKKQILKNPIAPSFEEEDVPVKVYEDEELPTPNIIIQYNLANGANFQVSTFSFSTYKDKVHTYDGIKFKLSLTQEILNEATGKLMIKYILKEVG